MAADAQLGDKYRQRFCPKRTAVVCHYTQPPQGSTTICTDELGPVVPRTFPRRLAGLPMGTVSRRCWTTVEDRRKPGCMERSACAMARN